MFTTCLKNDLTQVYVHLVRVKNPFELVVNIHLWYLFSGARQQPMMQQYKMSQNQVHGSPGSNYQQTTVTQNSPG